MSIGNTMGDLEIFENSQKAKCDGTKKPPSGSRKRAGGGGRNKGHRGVKVEDVSNAFSQKFSTHKTQTPFRYEPSEDIISRQINAFPSLGSYYSSLGGKIPLHEYYDGNSFAAMLDQGIMQNLEIAAVDKPFYQSFKKCMYLDHSQLIQYLCAREYSQVCTKLLPHVLPGTIHDVFTLVSDANIEIFKKWSIQLTIDFTSNVSSSAGKKEKRIMEEFNNNVKADISTNTYSIYTVYTASIFRKRNFSFRKKIDFILYSLFLLVELIREKERRLLYTNGKWQSKFCDIVVCIRCSNYNISRVLERQISSYNDSVGSFYAHVIRSILNAYIVLI